MKKINLDILYSILLFLLIILLKYPVLNLPYYWDDMNYVISTVDYIYNNSFTPFLWEYSLGHPPFFFLFVGGLFKVFGNSTLIAHLSIILFSFLTLLFTYLIGKKLFNRKVGIISSFNKGMSGGGFGPVVTGGQMVLGKDHKGSIGCTTAAEFPICIIGFLLYLLTKGISNWSLIYSLGIGALIGGFTGPWLTKKINKKSLKIIVSILMITLGILILLKTAGIINLKISA